MITIIEISRAGSNCYRLSYRTHSILQTSCDNISSILQVTVKLTATRVARRGRVENVSIAAPPIGINMN